MCSTSIYIAGRYNKYSRNLSQSPWIDKNDARIKHSVQELIEDGLNKHLSFNESIFSACGREDVDVKMLGNGRPFVFRIKDLMCPSQLENNKILNEVQEYVNSKHGSKIHLRDLQVVTKQDVDKYMRDTDEDKTKEYRALCCCSRKLTQADIDKINSIENLEIEQKTPIRVLHRRSLAVRRRKIYKMSIERAKINDSDILKENELDHAYILTLSTEAGTYIKEFVHGDFGRTKPNLGSLLKECVADLVELDVMQVHLCWPPPIYAESKNEAKTTDAQLASDNDSYLHDSPITR